MAVDEQAFITEAIKRGLLTFPQVQECMAAQEAMTKAGVSAKIWDVVVLKKFATEAQVNEVQGKNTSKTHTFGPFTLLSKLGEGGMGVVYRAKKQGAESDVAIKVLPEKFSQTEGATRFEREAKTAIALSHPNIVKGFEYGKINNRFFYSMEFVKGKVVSDLIKEQKHMDENAALQIAMQMVAALEAIHRLGLVHRDVKPENIIVSESGVVKLMDLGLVKSTLGEMTSLTKDGHTIGSPHYMSPEQVQGKDADIRSDIYSLGATLYHMVTGTKPFDSTSTMEIFKKQLNKEALPEPKGVSEPFLLLLEKMMAREPKDRHQAPAELSKDLFEVFEGKPPKGDRLAPGKSVIRRGTAPARIPTQRKSPTPLPTEAPKKSPIVLIGAVAGGVLLVAAVVVIFLMTRGPSPEELAAKAEKIFRSQLTAGSFNDAAETLKKESAVLGEKAGELESELIGTTTQAWEAFQESLKKTVDADRFDAARKEVEKFKAKAGNVTGMDTKILRGMEWIAGAERTSEQRKDAEIRYNTIAAKNVDEWQRELRKAEDNPVLTEKIQAKIRELQGLPPVVRQPDPPPPPPDTPPESSADQLLGMADKLLADAKTSYENGRTKGSLESLNEAGFKAEDARIKYTAVQEILEGNKRKHAADQLKICIQLMRLVNDAKKALAVVKPDPKDPPAAIKPDDPPPAIKPDEPPPPPAKIGPSPELLAAVETCSNLLAKYASGDASVRPSDARAVARSFMNKLAQRDERVSATVYIFLRLEHEPAWIGDAERKAVGEYLSKVDWKKFDEMGDSDHVQAITLLAEARSKLKPGGEALFVLQLAHLNRMLAMNSANPAFAKWGKDLNLSSVDLPGGLCLAAPSAATIVKAGQKTDDAALSELRKISGADPYVQYFRAYRELCAYCVLDLDEKKKQVGDFLKVFRDVRAPEAFKKLCRSLSESIKPPCKACNGTGKVDCKYCEDGQASYVCDACKGWGGTDKMPCMTCRGAAKDCNACNEKGYRWGKPCQACNERGRFKDTCKKCKGDGKVDDIQCKEPWAEPKMDDFVTAKDCVSCRKTGFAFDRALIPCADCGGVGKVLSESPALLKKK